MGTTKLTTMNKRRPGLLRNRPANYYLHAPLHLGSAAWPVSHPQRDTQIYVQLIITRDLATY